MSRAHETMAPAVTAAHETPATDGSLAFEPGCTTTVSIMAVAPTFAMKSVHRAATMGRGDDGSYLAGVYD